MHAYLSNKLFNFRFDEQGSALAVTSHLLPVLAGEDDHGVWNFEGVRVAVVHRRLRHQRQTCRAVGRRLSATKLDVPQAGLRGVSWLPHALVRDAFAEVANHSGSEPYDMERGERGPVEVRSTDMDCISFQEQLALTLSMTLYASSRALVSWPRSPSERASERRNQAGRPCKQAWNHQACTTNCKEPSQSLQEKRESSSSLRS